MRADANAAPGGNQVTRNVYDASGVLVNTLEPIASVSSTTFEFAVTKNIYDGAGRLTDQIRYFLTRTLSTAARSVTALRRRR